MTREQAHSLNVLVLWWNNPFGQRQNEHFFKSSFINIFCNKFTNHSMQIISDVLPGVFTFCLRYRFWLALHLSTMTCHEITDLPSSYRICLVLQLSNMTCQAVTESDLSAVTEYALPCSYRAIFLWCNWIALNEKYSPCRNWTNCTCFALQ